MPDRSLKILVVEDHGDTSRVMARLLQSHGHDVRVAEGVQAALTIAGSESIDLVISDIGLPDGNGHDLMRQIQAIRPTRGIALSGYGSSEDVRQAKDAGFAAHVTKPVDFMKLKVLIDQVSPSIKNA
jgi:CheY-like chemotaxis protein